MRRSFVVPFAWLVFVGATVDVGAQAAAPTQIIQIELAPGTALPKDYSRERMLGSFLADILRGRSVSISLPDASLVNWFARQTLRVSPNANVVLRAPSPSMLNASRIDSARFRQVVFAQRVPDLQRDLRQSLSEPNLPVLEQYDRLNSFGNTVTNRYDSLLPTTGSVAIEAGKEVALFVVTDGLSSSPNLSLNALGTGISAIKTGLDLITIRQVGLGLKPPERLPLPHARFTVNALGNQFNSSGIQLQSFGFRSFDGFSRVTSTSTIITATTFRPTIEPFGRYGFNPYTDAFTRQTTIQRTTTVQTGTPASLMPSAWK